MMNAEQRYASRADKEKLRAIEAEFPNIKNLVDGLLPEEDDNGDFKMCNRDAHYLVQRVLSVLGICYHRDSEQATWSRALQHGETV